MIQKEPFVQHLIKVLETDLLDKLPDEDIQVKMLWSSQIIIDDTITQFIRELNIPAEQTDVIDDRG